MTTPTVRSASLTERVIRPVNEVAVCSPYFSSLANRQVSLSELTNYPLTSLGEDTKSFEFYSGFFSVLGLTYRPDIEAFTADPDITDGSGRPRRGVCSRGIFAKRRRKYN